MDDLRIIAHVDLDMFYAAIVLREEPELIGKPLIVGNPNARVSKRGVVLTCSYEARKFGVHSGMSMAEALKRCPHAEIRKSYYELNKTASKNIMEYLKSFGVPTRVASIDEAYLDITDIVKDMYEAFNWAKEVKKWTVENQKITCSVGIGHTKVIAKIASDYKKPNAITVVTESGIEEFFSDLKLSKIPGIGKKSALWLASRGFTNTNQFIDMTRSEMVANLGSTGEFIYKVINGKTSTDLTSEHQRKSISHETTFHGTPGDIPLYLQKLDSVFNRTYQELLRKNMLTKTLTVKLRFQGFKTITRAKTLTEYTKDKDLLYQTMLDLAKPYLSDERGFRLLGVRFSQLEDIVYTITQLADYF